MLSETFCYWDKQLSADSNATQFHLTLKCTKDQSSHFCDCFLISKWIFQHNDRGLNKFHAGSVQPLVGVVISNSSYPTIKNNNVAYHAFWKYWMQAREFLNQGFLTWGCWNQFQRVLGKVTYVAVKGLSMSFPLFSYCFCQCYCHNCC